MDRKLRLGLAVASIVFGLLLYILAVTGILQANPTPPLDIGLVATTSVFVLLGLGGVMVVRSGPMESS